MMKPLSVPRKTTLLAAATEVMDPWPLAAPLTRSSTLKMWSRGGFGDGREIACAFRTRTKYGCNEFDSRSLLAVVEKR